MRTPTLSVLAVGVSTLSLTANAAPITRLYARDTPLGLSPPTDPETALVASVAHQLQPRLLGTVLRTAAELAIPGGIPLKIGEVAMEGIQHRHAIKKVVSGFMHHLGKGYVKGLAHNMHMPAVSGNLAGNVDGVVRNMQLPAPSGGGRSTRGGKEDAEDAESDEGDEEPEGEPPAHANRKATTQKKGSKKEEELEERRRRRRRGVENLDELD